MSGPAYRFNDSEFAYEMFEDEIIVLHLIRGTYYTLGGSARPLWDALIAAQPVDRLAEASADRYGIEPQEAESDLNDFVARLLEHRILSEADAADGPMAEPRDWPQYYQPPSFGSHSDMEDLLTLDPIHDVDPQKGWPHSPSA